MLTFESEQLIEQIRPLPRQLRVAFAVACAQRQIPNYLHKFSVDPIGDANTVVKILRNLWKGAERNIFALERLRRDLEICEELVTYYEHARREGNEYPEDAVSSLAYALDTVFSHGAQEAMWAASRARDALFAYITERFDLDAGTQHGRSLINSFSIMQAELARQQADLTELHAAVKHPGSEAAVINKIKRRAERDAASFFG